MKAWVARETPTSDDLNGNFRTIAARIAALGFIGGNSMKVWSAGDGVSHDDLNANFNELMARLFTLEQGGITPPTLINFTMAGQQVLLGGQVMNA